MNAYSDGNNNAAAVGPRLTELESLQLKANIVTDESLESTRRMVAMCEDSHAAGAKTLAMLDNQGENLRRMEGGLDTMNADMKKAEKNITQMQKLCGICLWPGKRGVKFVDNDAKFKTDSSSSSSKARSTDNRSNGGVNYTASTDGQENHGHPNGGGLLRRINNDAREDEMEENLNAVNSMLGNLKSMANDMNSELDVQNAQIDRITAKTTHVETRISTANRRTEKFLEK